MKSIPQKLQLWRLSMKKRSVVFLIPVIIVLFTAGIFLAAGGSKDKATGKPFEGTSIHVALIDEPREQTLKEITPEFEEATGMEVDVELLGFEPLVTKELTASQGRTGEYDVMQIVYFEVPVYAEAGWLYDLTDWVERDEAEVQPDDIHPVLRDAHATHKGKWYGMPMHVNSHAFFYRKDIFDEMNLDPPGSWEECISHAKKITNRYAPELYGITFMGAPDIQLGGEISSIISGLGGYFYDVDTFEPTFDSPAGVKTFEILQELVKWAPPGVTGYALDANYNAFAQGQAAMCVAWTTGVFFFNDPATSKIVDKWEVMSMPGGYTLQGGWSITVSEFSKNKEAAWEWIKWASSPDMEVRLLGNMEAPRISLLEDPEIQEKYPNNKAFYRALEGGPAHWPQIRGSLEILSKAAQIGNEVEIGAKTPKQAAQELNEQVRQLLINQGYLEE
jgi:multiple sugar transport system substrate-binding protein